MEEIRKSYEFTLDRLGQDLNAGPLWLEYTRFLAAPKQARAAARERAGREARWLLLSSAAAAAEARGSGTTCEAGRGEGGRQRTWILGGAPRMRS